MKKYQQLILVTLSILSLVSLLFYRHEYNRLRYVLEVLNFFGTPGLSAPQAFSCAQNISSERHLMSEPLPGWQRISNNLYVYSAYWETLGDKGHVKAIAIGMLSENINYGCNLWYEGSEESIKGSFSAVLQKNQDLPSRNSINSKYFSKTSKTKGFTFYCETLIGNSIPFGVTFYKTNNDEVSQAFVPVISVNTKTPPQNTTAICIMPMEYPQLTKSQYLEFLSFHKVIGITDFIVYGAAFQHNIISTILRDPSFEIDLIPLLWNYPFIGDLDVMRVVAESDCLMRTKGFFENVVVLKWNQFLIPKDHTNINNVLIDFDATREVPRFQLSTFLFCLEYNDDPKSDVTMPLVFRKTRYSILKMDIPITVYRSHLKTGSTRKISSNVAVAHWYTKCDMFNLKLPNRGVTKNVDHSMLRFSSEFLQSKILKL